MNRPQIKVAVKHLTSHWLPEFFLDAPNFIVSRDNLRLYYRYASTQKPNPKVHLWYLLYRLGNQLGFDARDNISSYNNMTTQITKFMTMLKDRLQIKVGDTVELIKSSNWSDKLGMEVGDIGKVSWCSLHRDSGFHFQVRFNGSGFYFDTDQFKKVLK